MLSSPADGNREKRRGRAGQHPYMETKCCRLQQTTSLKNGAHGAQSRQRIESDGLGLGSIEIHTMPMAARAQNGFWTPVGLRRGRSGGRGNGKSMTRFGGPGEIRTHDLFHAMEGRSHSSIAQCIMP